MLLNVEKPFNIDSPSTMTTFCCLLNERHKHIISLPCALHALNLLAKDLCKFEDAVPIVKSNCMLVNFCTSSHVDSTTPINGYRKMAQMESVSIA